MIGLEVQSRKPGVEKFAVEDIELTAMRQAARNIPPYQRLLSAALRGEHDLFASQETIEEAWRIVDPILGNATPIHEYDHGSWGHGRGRPPPSRARGGTRLGDCAGPAIRTSTLEALYGRRPTPRT